jgi:hypothetical protein
LHFPDIAKPGNNVKRACYFAMMGAEGHEAGNGVIVTLDDNLFVVLLDIAQEFAQVRFCIEGIN